MLSSEKQNNLSVIHVLSDIYDSDKVNFIKSISDIIVEAGFSNTVILPNSVLAGNLKRNGSEVKPFETGCCPISHLKLIVSI